ncbi:MAG: low molecular weight phosphotyrosine protein phosphatase [Anaerolineales bacterium]|nr:low molecular weight phosphotyrosine protein phosphatase [Anaerolineales bacterium]
MKTHILFVCMANIVRSPVAENLCKHAVTMHELEKEFVIDSAGTTPGFAGQPPHPVMTRVAAAAGVVNAGLSRTLTRQDLEEFDLILVMDSENYEDVLALTDREDQRKKIRYLRSFDSTHTGELDIKDPILGSAADFVEVFQIIQASINGLLDFLQQKPLQK